MRHYVVWFLIVAALPSSSRAASQEQSAFTTWAKSAAIPLTSLSDPAPLQNWAATVAKKKVVFLGEPDHYIHEKFQYQLLLIRTLMPDGFNVLGREMGRSDASRIDHYLETGDEKWLARVALWGFDEKLHPGRDDKAKGALHRENKKLTELYAGSYLSKKLGEQLYSVWMLYEQGHNSDLKCVDVTCPIQLPATHLEHVLAQVGDQYLLPLPMSHRRGFFLDSDKDFVCNGHTCHGQVGSEVDALFFVKTVNGLQASDVAQHK